MLALVAFPFLCAAVSATILKRSLWQPSVGVQWQIDIHNNISVDPFSGNVPSSPAVWDIDLFNTPKEVFDKLHEQGKKVICYFSAGTGEDWRPDYLAFPAADLGTQLGCWPGEKYVNFRSAKVWDIMAKRIQLASQKGCDGIDPDNIDAYANANGFSLTEQDAVTYFNKMAAEAKKYSMSIGLKNALEILPKVINNIQFAVNEECQAGGDCAQYGNLVKAGKPVFHIEYVTFDTSASGKITLKSELDGLQNASTEEIRQVLCVERSLSGKAQKTIDGMEAPSPKQYSTVIKGLLLDGWVYYCDGTSYTTPQFDVGTGGPTDGYCSKALKSKARKAKAKGITGASTVGH